MTTTIDDLTTSEADLTPGTLCWVQTDSTVPALARNGRCLAVKTDVGSQRWLLLIPANGDEDPYSSASEVGWKIQHHLTFDQMRTLNLNRFVNSHRGWWPGQGATFIETAVGHWCIEHQVFHATESCPPEATFADRIAALERELAEARADVEQARIQGEQNLEAFKVRVSEHLASAASAHDLCSVYDEEAEEAGLYPRMQNIDVEVEVTYRQTVTVKARDFEAAAEIVRGKGTTSYYEPPSPFRDESDIEIGGTYSLNVSVVD